MGTDIPLDKATLDILGPGEYLLRDYENGSQPQPGINLYIPFFPTLQAGDTIHSPYHCLPCSGWIPTSRERIHLTRPDGASISVNRYVVSNMGELRLVLYWFQAHVRGAAMRVVGQVLSDLRFNSYESQRRRDGAFDDADAEWRGCRRCSGAHDDAWITASSFD